VIIITGYPSSLEDMRATFKLKVSDYLAKPFSLNQLRQTLQNATGDVHTGPDHRAGIGRANGCHAIKRCWVSGVGLVAERLWPVQAG